MLHITDKYINHFYKNHSGHFAVIAFTVKDGFKDIIMDFNNESATYHRITDNCFEFYKKFYMAMKFGENSTNDFVAIENPNAKDKAFLIEMSSFFKTVYTELDKMLVSINPTDFLTQKTTTFPAGVIKGLYKNPFFNAIYNIDENTCCETLSNIGIRVEDAERFVNAVRFLRKRFHKFEWGDELAGIFKKNVVGV